MKNSHHAFAVVVLAASLLASAAPASAQLLRGSVVDAGTGSPIPAALITVRDSARAVRARILTDTAGKFDFGLGTVPHSLTVEFVGYAPQTLTVANRDQHFAIKLQPSPVALKGIVAERKRECRESDDPKVVSVWYAARAALGATRVANTRRFRTREFMQFFDVDYEHEGVDSMRFSIVTGADSYKAASPDSLRDFGYVRSQGGERLFFGPDAELLLSDGFVETHCFGIARDAKHAGLVGLAFWPKDGRKKTDIQGTMWVDEQAARLQTVEYTFTGLNTINDKLFSGKVDFDKLNDGSWVVRRWHIRLPRYATFALGRRGRTLVIGATDGGGEFLGFDRLSLPPDEIGTVRGSVFDSIALKPLANVPVFLVGTKYETTTDSAGNFELPNVGTGIHYVMFYDPRMALLPLGLRVVRISVERGGVTNAKLALPRAENLLALVCSKEKLQKIAGVLKYSGPVGAIAGTVTTNRGLPIGDAVVDAEWGSSEMPKLGANINKNVASLNTMTNASGQYIICGLPAPLPMTVRVRMGDMIVAEEQLKLDGLVHPFNIIVDPARIPR